MICIICYNTSVDYDNEEWLCHSLLLDRRKMTKKSISEQVTEICAPIVSNLGYELVEAKYAKGHRGMELTLYIYSENGITLEDCEKVSKAVDLPLDELNPTNDESYVLNVSSLGIDRPIKTEADARRNLNKKVEIKFYASRDGKKSIVGTLVAYSQDNLTIDVDGETQTSKFNEFAICTPVIEF